MKIRFKTLLQLAGLAVAVVALNARAANWEPGVNYFILAEPQPVQTGDKIEVLELFWYGCPHCYAFQPFLENWLQHKPDNVEFVLMPGIINPLAKFHAQVFYTFEALGITQQVHRDFYDAIHQRGHRIYNLEGLLAFTTKHGIDPDRVKAAFNSFAVDANVRYAQEMFGKYGATGVPTMIIDGKFRATVSSAGGHDLLLKLIDFLVDKAAKARAG